MRTELNAETVILICFIAWNNSVMRSKTVSEALFIWSRVPETTLPPSYPGRANFPLISLKNSTNCLHENANSSQGGETTRVGELSRLGR